MLRERTSFAECVVRDRAPSRVTAARSRLAGNWEFFVLIVGITDQSLPANSITSQHKPNSLEIDINVSATSGRHDVWWNGATIWQRYCTPVRLGEQSRLRLVSPNSCRYGVDPIILPPLSPRIYRRLPKRHRLFVSRATRKEVPQERACKIWNEKTCWRPADPGADGSPAMPTSGY
jgi:hypothetical protein